MRSIISVCRFQLECFLRSSIGLCALLFVLIAPGVSVPCRAASKPVINSFTAAGQKSSSGGNSFVLTWSTTGATKISIAPGSVASTSASGNVTTAPTKTTTYTLTATNAAGSVTSSATATVALAITTTSCPGGTQTTAYTGCTIAATGGTPPYTFTVDSNGKYAPLPEGMSINESTGVITAATIGGQGKYIPEIVVTDSVGNQATAQILFEINGNSAFLANIFPANSIFHHRVDAATTGLPVDTSPAAAIYSAYLSEPIQPLFGNKGGGSFPWGIPAVEVPYNQPGVSVATTLYSAMFTAGPIPSYAPVEGTKYSGGDRHVLVYLEPGPSTSSIGAASNPALYEMWEAIYEDGPWTDSSNALWANANGNALPPEGQGTSDAAGLPVAPLLVNADEVIGTGTPTAPNGAVKHPVRFTLNHMVNYWVWPATHTSGVGLCKTAAGTSISVMSEISESTPPATCTWSGPAGEIYRLKASVESPACAATSPQAAIIITGMRNYGIILADNGESGDLIGTPDARWNDSDLACLNKIKLSDFEPVNVSSLIVSNTSGQTSK
ncbi:MAG: hypothetical protein WBP85_09080 [Terracidiphilus sp.]